MVASKERVWVAEADGIAVGFVATGVSDPGRNMGEISMLAVDPDHQGGGIGTALTKFALERLKDAGMKVAVVETGGDPGHAAARRTYEKAGCTLLPIAPGTSRISSCEGPWCPDDPKPDSPECVEVEFLRSSHLLIPLLCVAVI